jgi:small-conductance mechanosensitive channel
MCRLLPLLLLAALLAVPGASSRAAAPAPAPAAATAPTPADMQQVLDVLDDPQKRAAFTKTLQTMVQVTHAAAAKAATPVPLAANSVGAQIIASSAGWAANLGDQVKALHSMLGDLPKLWNFTTQSFNDPDRRGSVLDAAWHLALVFLIAAGVEWAFYLALRRPVAALARRAPDASPIVASQTAPTAIGSTAQGDAQHAAEQAHDDVFVEETTTDTVGPEVSVGRQRRLSRTLRALRRAPLALTRLVMELLPVATFLALGWAGLTFVQPETRFAVWVAITAYVGLRITVAVARAVVSPNHPTLRLVHMTDASAAYAVRWVRRIATVVAIGYAGSVIGTQYGMSPAAREAFIKAVALVGHVLLIIVVLQCRRTVGAAIRRAAGEAGWGAVIAGRLAATWHLVAIFLIAGQWLVWAARVPNGYQRMWRIFLGTAAVMLVLRVGGNMALAGLERLFNVRPETASRYPGFEARAQFYLPLLRRTVSTVLWLVAALALLEAWGVNVFTWFRGNALGGRLASAFVSVLVVGLLLLLVWEAANAHFERRLARLTHDAHNVQAARLRTLLPILRTLLIVVLLAMFGLNVLSEIGVNVGPLLAGAGILGVAIGFGSQKLVQDFITGIFLLVENAMQVGDYVTVAGLSGTVENLSIRTMRLRAGDGSVHIIPFSSVTTVTNTNRGIGNVPVSVTVTSDTDTDRVSEMLADIARDMRGERRYADMMCSDFQLWGVDKLEPGAVTVVGQIVCTDGGRWPVQREFNRRLLRRLRDEKIRLTSPAQTVNTFAHLIEAARLQAPPDPAPAAGAQSA